MSEILKFEKIPQLNFLKETIDRLPEEEKTERVVAVYKYLLWARKYQLSHNLSKEREVAYGFLLLYHRQMMGMDIPCYEMDVVNKSREALKASNAAIAARRK